VLGGALFAIQTSRLVLLPLRGEHADHLFEGLSDDRLYEFIADTPPNRVESLRARYEKLAGRKSPDGTEAWLNWAVWSRHDQQYIGYVQATVRSAGICEIAYVFVWNMWGRGYGREAVAAMAAHLLDYYEARSLRAVVDPRNVRSVALLDALGFRQTGYRPGAERIRGVLTDEIEYVLSVVELRC
jgi:[ribosomal protein S5]-alanine N-acetyltransferase